MSDQRLIDLEIKIAHQESAFEDLQRTVYEQHKAIELLQATIDRLRKQFESLTSEGLEIGPANEKPPHY